ncbi:MAG: hypothetical protein IKY22_05510 [Bacteroidales bacterium]|nr:hypothetical protein [Bacteroidales bacterium]
MKLKKHFFCLAFMGFMCVGFAREPIKILNIHKEGGRSFLGITEPRYDKVDFETKIERRQCPYTGEVYELHISTLTCLRPGDIKCRRSVAEKGFKYNGVTISEDIFVETMNSMVDEIDEKLVKKEKEGKVVKKISVVADNNEQFIFSFIATWENGNEEGNADIQIVVYDITKELEAF